MKNKTDEISDERKSKNKANEEAKKLIAEADRLLAEADELLDKGDKLFGIRNPNNKPLVKEEHSNKLLVKEEPKNKPDKALDKGKSKNDLIWEENMRSFKEHEIIAAEAEAESKKKAIWDFIGALILLPFALVALPLLIFIVIFAILIDGVSGKS